MGIELDLLVNHSDWHTINNNNNPLIGVNVIAENPELGSVTDDNGEFLVAFVPVGIHKVTASYIGYTAVSKENVIVTLDQATNVNFQMDPTSIEMDAIVVSAEKP